MKARMRECNLRYHNIDDDKLRCCCDRSDCPFGTEIIERDAIEWNHYDGYGRKDEADYFQISDWLTHHSHKNIEVLIEQLREHIYAMRCVMPELPEINKSNLVNQLTRFQQ